MFCSSGVFTKPFSCWVTVDSGELSEQGDRLCVDISSVTRTV